jgi:hypothetical protein
MILKNILSCHNQGNTNAILGLGSKFSQSKIFISKGLNFSSLYQTANFSSSSLLQTKTSLEATAISNKVFSFSASPQLNNSATINNSNTKSNIIVSQGLGPINNGYAKKLLNYNFLASTSIATPTSILLDSCFGETTKMGVKSTINKGNIKNKVEIARVVYSEDIIKLISAFFKSIYCLISRPKFINTPDKIIIEILYYITIPDNNIFKWYNFIYKIQTSNNAILLGGQNKNNYALKKNKKKATIKTILNKNYFIKKTLFKLNNTNIVNLYYNKFAILFNLLQGLPLEKLNKIKQSNTLARLINKPIEFNLIRLHKSDYDSNILAQLFILILKKKNIRVAINKIFNKNNIALHIQAKATVGNIFKNAQQKEKNNTGQYAIPSLEGLGPNTAIAYISGLYIKIGGRLMREPIIPRLTTKKFEIGAIATGKVNFVDSARITKKNKKGAFTIKITYAQNFVF